MAIYKDTHDSLMLEELHIYGSQRLGIIKENRLLAKYINIFPPSSTFKTSMPNTPLIPYPYTLTPYHFGKKHYELTDWLGNVRVVINDKKTPQGTNPSDMTYAAQVLEVNDYYPFGSPLYGRRWSVGYRYGFNGKENDNEIMGNGNFQDYGARMYDTRLGRFISPDPIIVNQHKYQDLSPYQFASNTPIWGVDKDGLEIAYKNEQGFWTTAGDKLQHIPSAEEVKMMEKSRHLNGTPGKGALEIVVEELLNPLIITGTSAIFPMINQAYTISKEGLHPGRAYKKENELKWAVPYKLDSWSFKPLKSDLHETFEGKEGYEKGGKEIKDATIDVMMDLPIRNKLSKLITENVFSETFNKSIDLIVEKSKQENKK